MHSHTISAARQKGIALFASLIALVVIMLAAIALIRSTDTAQAIAGNLSIKRDITHESELAVQNALALFATGGALVNEVTRQTDLTGSNYYATAQASNAYGIPTSLVKQSTSGETAAGAGLTWSYMIDRMCPNTGAYDASTNACLTAKSTGLYNQATDVHAPKIPGTQVSEFVVVYRISVRVTDARGAQSYFQTTEGVPPE